ncbi:MAG: multicopper oxidase domain-containing protein, partial [Thaumarchaeota archaeon]|nr:multicopper oxidase domain-containing protein [Nitrososphaerota archaeon]
SILSIVAVVAVASVLFGSTYSNTQVVSGSAQSVSPATIDKVTPQTIDSVTAKDVQNAGGLGFNMVGADAIPLDQVAIEKAAGRTVHEVTLTAQSVDLPIPGGQMYHAMTFDGQVPGPTIRVTQGDVIEVTLNVPSTEKTGHSLDNHAGQLSAVPNFLAVMPGKSNTYAFIANYPGAFKYHCEGVNVIGMDQHVLSGMYGMVIVDPLNGYHKLLITRTATQGGHVVLNNTLVDPAAYEFTLQFNQLYLNPDGSYNQAYMFLHNTTWTVINGKPFGYDPVVTKVWKGAGGQNEAAPLILPVGQHIRYFVVNQGNMPLFFHIVGGQMDRVTQGNMVQAMGTQTWLIGGSQDAIIDVVYDQPGAYVIVNHDYAAIFSGAAAVQLAQASPAPNPSDAVPPVSSLPDTSIAQKTFVHCECTNDRAAQLGNMTGQ